METLFAISERLSKLKKTSLSRVRIIFLFGNFFPKSSLTFFEIFNVTFFSNKFPLNAPASFPPCPASITIAFIKILSGFIS